MEGKKSKRKEDNEFRTMQMGARFQFSPDARGICSDFLTKKITT